MILLLAVASLALVHSAAISKRQESCNVNSPSPDKRQSCLPPQTPEDCFYGYAFDLMLFDHQRYDCYREENDTIVFDASRFCRCKSLVEEIADLCQFDLDGICPTSPNASQPSGPIPTPSPATPTKGTTMVLQPTVAPQPQPTVVAPQPEPTVVLVPIESQPTIGTPSHSQCFDKSIDFQSCLVSSTYSLDSNAANFCRECRVLFQAMVTVCLPQNIADLETTSVYDFCSSVEEGNPSSVVPESSECLRSSAQLVSCLSEFDVNSAANNRHQFCEVCRSKLDENAKSCFGDVAEDNIQFLDNLCRILVK